MAEHGWRACAGVRVSGADAGPIAFEHDTCVGALADPTQNTGHFWVRVPLDPMPVAGDVVLRNTLFAGANMGDVAVLVGAAPAGWRANANVFDPDASFVWTGSAVDFAGWQTMSAGDSASQTCVPEFADADDFHLGTNDTCAADRGADLADVTHDIDGDERPMGPSADVGADERR
jgi:hypothetical protein